MEALFIILNDLGKYDEILQTLVNLEVRGATILESEGMAKALLKSEGLSSLLKGLLESSKTKDIGSSKTIFTVIKKDQVDPICSAIDEVLSKSNAKIKGFMFTIPVSKVHQFK